jgi:hypothetical protein
MPMAVAPLVREGNSLKIAGRQLRQAGRQCDGGFASIPARAERQFVQLLLDGGNHLGIGKADLMQAVAMKIEITASFIVLNPGAFHAAQNIQAGRGK